MKITDMVKIKELLLEYQEELIIKRSLAIGDAYLNILDSKIQLISELKDKIIEAELK